jgi:hypothetical protein
MIDACFDLLSAQLPAVKKFERKVVTYFKQLVVTSKHLPQTPSLSSQYEHATIQLQQLAENIQRSWSKPNNINSFVSLVCTLPKAIGELFDMKEVLFVFDDFDQTYQKHLR